MRRSARHFMAEKAAREIAEEIKQAGVDNLKFLAESGRSIVGTYLSGCSEAKKKEKRRDLSALLKMGVTIDMLLDKVARQIPEIEPIIKSMESYRKAEIAKVMSFLQEG